MQVRRVKPDNGAAKYLANLAKEVRHLKTEPTGSMVVEEAITTVDPETGVETIFGQLPDGTVGFQPYVNDITPPGAPSTPFVVSEVGQAFIQWDGLEQGGLAQPKDYNRTEVEISTDGVNWTVVATFYGKNSHVVSDLVPGTVYSFRLFSYDYNDNKSTPSGTVTATPISAAEDPNIDAALKLLKDEDERLDGIATGAQASASAADARAGEAEKKALEAVGLSTGSGDIKYQDTAPAGATDLVWVDTNDGNKAYTWSGSQWVLVEGQAAIDAIAQAGGAHALARIASLEADAAAVSAGDAQKSADGKNMVFYQPTKPSLSTRIDGDTWFDTDDGNKIYVFKTNDFVSAQDQGISTAIIAATGAQTTADGKNAVFYQTTKPSLSGRKTGDTWFDTDDGNKIYVFSNGDFRDAQDDAISTAIVAATGAQTTADGKNASYYQTAKPTGGTYKKGDIWFDTDDGNKVYVHDGQDFKLSQDVAIGTAQRAATAAQATANGKNTAYYQTTKPSGGTYKLGDQWYDTDDGYRLYVHDGQDFKDAQDRAIQTAQATASAAQTTANGKNTAFYQPTKPSLTGRIKGDQWYDTDDGYKLYVHDGVDFRDAHDRSIDAAQIAATGAQTTADGKNASYYQDNKPTGGTYKKGDLWFDTNDGYKLYTHNGIDFILSQDSATALTTASSASSAASAAQATANGKNSVTYSTSAAPTGAVAGAKAGDTWFRKDASNIIIGHWEYSGSSYVPKTIGDQVVANLNAGKLTAGTIAADRIGANSIEASKLVVSDFTNLYHNPLFINGEDFSGGSSLYSGTEVVPAGRNAVLLAGRDHVSSNYVTMNAGDSFYFEFTGKNISTGTAALSVTAWILNNANGYGTGWSGYSLLSYETGLKEIADLGDGWKRYSSTTKIPETWTDVAKGSLYFQLEQATSGGATQWLISDIVWRRMAAGQLIVDGVITADKIKTGSLSSSTGVFGVLDASSINAGTLAADRLAANDIRAKLLDADLINADEILVEGSITAESGVIGSLDAGTITSGYLSSERIEAGSLVIGKVSGLSAELTGLSAEATAKADAAQLAAITTQAYSQNPTFDDWTGALPAGYSSGFTTSPTKDTTNVRAGKVAARWVHSNTTTQGGMSFGTLLSHAPNLEYFTVEMEFRLASGGLGGAGMILDWVGMTGGRAQINLASEIASPTIGKWYRITKTLRRPTTATGTFTNMGGYLMSQWSGHGTGAIKDITFDWFNVRPATAEEITSYGTPALITDTTLPRIEAVTNGKTFRNVLSSTSRTSSVTNMVISTPITLSAYMTRVDISGYNYSSGGETDIALSVGFYAYNSVSKIINHSVSSTGTVDVNVQLGIDANGKVVIILTRTSGNFSYPSITINQVNISYTSPPDSFKDGWTVAHSASTTAITDIVTPVKQAVKATADRVDGWTATGTTEINGGMIKTDTIEAGSIKANSIGVNQLAVSIIDAGKINVGLLDAVAIRTKLLEADTIDAIDIIASGSITATNGIIGSIDAGKITVGEMDAKHIKASTITTTHIAASGISASAIKFGTMHGDRIQAASITTGHITTAGISASAIKVGTMHGDRIQAGTITTGHITTTGLSASAIKFGVMHGDRITAQSLTSNHIVVAGLDAAVIKFGEMEGARIKAGTIFADRLVVGNGANLFNDPEGKDVGTSTGWSLNSGITVSATGGKNGTGSITIPASASQVGSYYGLSSTGKMSTVVPESSYRVGAWAYSTTEVPVGAASLYVRVYDQAGGYVFSSPSVRSNEEIIPAGTWHYISGAVTIPAGANTKASIGVYKQAAHTGSLVWSDISLQVMASGKLIVDGAIDGRIITGSTLRTDDAGARIELSGYGSENRLFATRADGTTFFDLNAQTGLTMEGEIKTVGIDGFTELPQIIKVGLWTDTDTGMGGPGSKEVPGITFMDPVMEGNYGLYDAPARIYSRAEGVVIAGAQNDGMIGGRITLDAAGDGFSPGGIDMFAEGSINAVVNGGDDTGGFYVNGGRIDGTKNMLDGQNLNDLDYNGEWHQESNARAAAGSNYPIPYAGYLRTRTGYNGAFKYQWYYVYKDHAAAYYRSQYQGIWGAWQQIPIGQTRYGVSFANGWTNFGAGYAYLKTVEVSPGMVTISGMPKPGTRTSGITLGYVASAHIPDANAYTSCTIRAGGEQYAGMLKIGTDGSIQIYGDVGSTSYLAIGTTYALKGN